MVSYYIFKLADCSLCSSVYSFWSLEIRIFQAIFPESQRLGNCFVLKWKQAILYNHGILRKMPSTVSWHNCEKMHAIYPPSTSFSPLSPYVASPSLPCFLIHLSALHSLLQHPNAIKRTQCFLNSSAVPRPYKLPLWDCITSWVLSNLWQQQR